MYKKRIELQKMLNTLVIWNKAKPITNKTNDKVNRYPKFFRRRILKTKRQMPGISFEFLSKLIRPKKIK